MQHNSDFKYDLKLGIKGESLLAKILTDQKIEVKTDLQAHQTGNVYVEYFSRNKPSGLSTTEAAFYAFILSNDNIIIISTAKLKILCRKYLNTSRDRKGGDSNTSKGILIPIQELIHIQ